MSPTDRGSRPFDLGLQPERTALAWRRTGLALTVAALAGSRVLPTMLGAWALVPAGVGLGAAIAVLVLAHHRYVRHHGLLTTHKSDRIPLPDGRLPALVAALTLLAGAACVLVFLAVARP